MAVTIYGAGAIGGTVAAHLARSGEAVRCVDRVADIASPDPAAARASLDGMAARARGRIKVRSGPWRHIAVRKRPTEVDQMLGWLVVAARRPGLDAPLADRLWQQVKEVEAGTRAQALANLEKLDRRRRELEPAPAG